jgi:hypothetical protein
MTGRSGQLGDVPFRITNHCSRRLIPAEVLVVAAGLPLVLTFLFLSRDPWTAILPARSGPPVPASAACRPVGEGMRSGLGFADKANE